MMIFWVLAPLEDASVSVGHTVAIFSPEDGIRHSNKKVM
jgi:hypothetical protein